MDFMNQYTERYNHKDIVLLLLPKEPKKVLLIQRMASLKLPLKMGQETFIQTTLVKPSRSLFLKH